MPDWPLDLSANAISPYALLAGQTFGVPQNRTAYWNYQIDSSEPTSTFLDISGYLVEQATPAAFPTATITVAASNAPDIIKQAASFACSGVDDDAVINQAIAALPSSGGLLLLSEGTFNVWSPILFQRDNSALLGMARGTTWISVAQGFSGSEVISCNRKDLGIGTNNYRPCSKIEVGNFTLIGNQVGTQSTTDGIYFSGSRSKLHDVDVYQMNGLGIRVRGVLTTERNNVGDWSCYGTLVEACKIHENGNGGINFDSASTDAGISSCEIFQNAGPGLQTAAVINEMSRCYVWQNFDQSAAGGGAQGNGLQLNPGAGRMTIVGNKIEQNRAGINFIGGSGYTVIGNIIASNSTAASTSSSSPNIPAAWIAVGANNVRSDIEFNGSGGAPDGVLIVGNYVAPATYGTDESAYAISITSGTHIICRFNYLLAGLTGIVHNTLGGGNIFSCGENLGYVTEASGTATIAAASTSVAVTHGLAYAPAAGDLSIVLTNRPTVDPGLVWISGIGATTFTINCSTNPGTGGATFGWSARTSRFS